MERSAAWLTGTNVSTRAISIFVCLTAAAVAAAVVSGKFTDGLLSYVVPCVLVISFCVISSVIARVVFSVGRAHREAVDALDLTEQRYKSLCDSVLEAILIVDGKGICLEANPAASSLFGLAREDLRGRSIRQFLLANDDSANAQEDLLKETRARTEIGVLRADGRRATVEYTVTKNFVPGLQAVLLRDITQKRQAEAALRASEQRFQQMADNIQEIFWMFDVETKAVLYVNSAYEAITGRLPSSMTECPESHAEVVHGEDRVRLLSRLAESVQKREIDEEFRIVRSDGAVRWLWLRGFPIMDDAGILRRLVGTAQDITARKLAEDQMAQSLYVAEAARAETEALRRASLAVTQNLSLDCLLDTLLEMLLEMVPCERAQVILREAGTRLLLAREITNAANGHAHTFPETFDAEANRHLSRVLQFGESVLVPDRAQDPDWPGFKSFSHLHSWLCVPLKTSTEILGVLSLGDVNPHAFTPEHLRIAGSFAIPAAAAIQNARLYEQAEIFRSELQHRVSDLERAERLHGEL